MALESDPEPFVELIATTFTGNVPHYDIIASDEAGRHVSMQVKASRGASWQFGDISRYREVAFDGKRQVVGKKLPCPVHRLVMVFVRIDPEGNDRFYILPWLKFLDLLVAHHEAFLAKHGGVRPKRWENLYYAITESDLAPNLDRWETVEKGLR
jgi:hypothetical protein